MIDEKTIKFIKFFFYILSFLLMTACTNNRSIDKDYSNPSIPDREEVMMIYRSPAEIAARNDLVVIGYVIEPREVINLSLIPEISLEVGQVYQFKVEEYLKGNGEEVIFVVHTEGSIYREGVGINFTKAEIEEAKELSTTPPLAQGKMYILFLMKSKSQENRLHPNYYLSEHWKFDLSNPENIVPEVSPNYNGMGLLKFPKTLDEMKKHLLDPVNHPYPDPGYRPDPFQEEPPPPVPAPQDPPGPYPDPESAGSSNQNEVLAYPPP